MFKPTMSKSGAGLRTMVALSAVTALVALPPACAASHRGIRCHPHKRLITEAPLRGFHQRIRFRHAVTVQENARVWVARPGPGGPDFGTPYFACWKPSGRGHFLGANSSGAAVSDTFLGSFSLSGRYVALHISARGEANFDRFRSVDVRTGRRLRDSGRIETSRETTTAAELVVNRFGALAWIQAGALQALDADGRRVLATGALRALALSGGTLYWTQDGTPRSAKLR